MAKRKGLGLPRLALSKSSPGWLCSFQWPPKGLRLNKRHINYKPTFWVELLYQTNQTFPFFLIGILMNMLQQH